MFYPEDYEKDFEAPGKVSIWFCRFENEEDFNHYIREKFTEDDDTWSDFYLEFRMGFIDHDFMDAVYHPQQPSTVEEILEPVSYSASVIKNINAKGISIDAGKYNTVICLYEFDFVPDKDYVRKNDHVDYIGSFDYEPN